MMDESSSGSVPRRRGHVLYSVVLPLLIIFAEPGFPFHGVSEVVPVPGGARVCRTVEALEKALTPGRILVWRHGGAFPTKAWPALVRFLEGGGSLLHLGGEPFTRPVTGKAGERVVLPRTVSLLKALQLNQSYPISAGGAMLSYRDGGVKNAPPDHRVPAKATVAILEPRLCGTRDFAHEDGAPGARDAILTPLGQLRRQGEDVRFPFATASLAIDHFRGRFAGGRWVFRLLSSPIPASELGYLIEEARQEPVDFRVDPTFGCFHAGERPSVQVRVHRPRARGVQKLAFDLEVVGPGGKGEWCRENLGFRVGKHGAMEVPLAFEGRPGLHRVIATLAGRSPMVTGFWIYDEALFRSGDTLTFDEYTLRRNGVPEPVIGTTVMSGTVHRKFLFEPNAAVWDDTFAELAALNINLVRTGVWSAYRKISLDPNVVDEAWLRALEALYLSARKHGIPVVFTFFAFVPEAFGGVNPYLDPRAVEGQRAYLATVAGRFREAREMLWDFINEPSFSNPEKLWRCRPTGDRFERAAFLEWLRGRYCAGKGGAVWQEEVRSRWRLRPDEGIGLPGEDDFADRSLFEPHRPYRAREFCHFAQDAFEGWVREMTAAIRQAGSTAAVTVGQDEGGLVDRPGPLFHHRAVDYTSIHTWWNNDALLWDGLMAKAPGKPLLVSETGIMQRERLSGEAIRTPEGFARLLSRKIGHAFAAGAFGLVQWCYSVNPYMDLDNEVAIGLRRVDGSYKPEHRVLREFAAFFARNRQWFEKPDAPGITLVMPHGDGFSPRGLQVRGTRAALAMLHALDARRIQVVSEYRTDQDLGASGVIVLPACRGVSEGAWRHITAAVKKGATLLCSGWFEADDAGRPAHRLGTPSAPLRPRELSRVERLDPEDGNTELRFSADIFQSAYAAGGILCARRIRVGEGTIVHHPVPIEWAENSPARSLWYVTHLPDRVLPEGTGTGLDITAVHFRKACLYVVINPGSRPVEFRLRSSASHFTVPAGRARMFILGGDGNLIDRSHP